jgi:S1-C subfamily serine protease
MFWRQFYKFSLFLPIFFNLIFFSCSQKSSTLDNFEKGIAQVIKEAGPSVISISVKNKKQNTTKYGSGVIIPGGYVITTENLLQNVDEITIHLQDGKEIPDSSISMINCDFETDVSLIELKEKNLRPAKIAKQIEMGSLGIALGNTEYSVGLQATLGTVGSSWIGGVDFYDENLLILNVPCGLCLAGTPVFNTRSELIGLIEGRLKEGRDVVLLLPVTTCLKVSDILKKDGEVKRGWIGIKSPPETERLKHGKGVEIGEVLEGSPAFKAGLLKGDLVVECNKTPIKNKVSLMKMISQYKNGTEITLTLIRDGKRIEKNLIVEEAKEIPQMRRCMGKSI